MSLLAGRTQSNYCGGHHVIDQAEYLRESPTTPTWTQLHWAVELRFQPRILRNGFPIKSVVCRLLPCTT